MAKDGTNRGGRRVRAGGKAKPLAEKIAEGIPANIMELPISGLEAEELEGTQELAGEDMPNPSEYLSARQKDGRPLGADEIFRETWKWLRDRKCEKLVNPRLLESYSQAFARYIQAEEAISLYGLLSRHPTTGGACTSPFIQMSQSFQKQANVLWYEIYDIVRANCTTAYEEFPQNDMMERLLRKRSGNN